MFKIFFLISVSYIIYFILLPPLQANDETQHVKNVVAVSQGIYPFLPDKSNSDYKLRAVEKMTGSLNFEDKPDQMPDLKNIFSLRESSGDYNMARVSSYEAHYPPLYYMVGSIFYYISKISSYLFVQYYIIRLTSAVFYFGSVIVGWRILKILLKETNAVNSILIFFSINPLVLKMGIGVNPDIGLTFFSLFFLYLFLNINSNSLISKNLLIISIVSSLSALTKISGLFTNIAFSAYLLFAEKINAMILKRLVLFQTVFWLILSPWLLFMFFRYHSFFPEPFSTSCGNVGHMSPLIISFSSLAAFRHTLMHYSGFMGPAWPHPFNWFFISYVIFFIFFVLIGIFNVIKEKKHTIRAINFYLLSLGVFLLVLSFKFRLASLDCDLQGRYMLPGFLILCYLVYRGIVVLLKNKQVAALSLKCFAIFHYLFILFTVIILRYYV